VRPGRLRATAAILLAAAATSGRAGDVPGAAIVLEARIELLGRVSDAAPPRFVLLGDGRVFVGGTDRLQAGRLDKAAMSGLERRVERVRKLPGLGESVSLGGDASRRFRLRLLKGRTLDVVVAGAPASAPRGLEPLAGLVEELLRFHHPTLRPWTPERYALLAREGELLGGCRPWTFEIPLRDALIRPQAVEAASASGWPTGANPASVCEGGRRYVVTLRPLLPGEQP